MTHLLRTLWHRLLPPGGDVAVARPVDDDREAFIPVRHRIRIAPAMRMAWQAYRQEPQRFADARPGPHELGPYGHCWWWAGRSGRSWIRCHVDNLEPDDLWLPYQAIADPGARP